MNSNNRKRVLIVTYYWPPSGGIGVHRCLKFTKYLRDFEWEPVVYVPKNAHYNYLDEGNLKDIPDNLTIIRGRIIEPFRIFKLLTGRKQSEPLTNPIHVRKKKFSIIEKLSIWIRGNLFIPDARALWIRPSVRRLIKYLKEEPVDVLFSDGPPHTNTVIACRVASKTGIPWLADFQDPWTQVDYYPLLMLTARADKKHKRLEQEAFREAEKITIASPTWKKDLEQIGAKDVDVLYYGYDEEDFTGTGNALMKEFVISHAGLLGSDRNPENFYKALIQSGREMPELLSDLILIFAGMVDFTVKNSIINHGLEQYTRYPGVVSKKEAIKLSTQSQLLFLPLNKAANIKGRLPGKLYEYLRTCRPIMGIGPTDSDAARILEDTGHGKCFDYEDLEGMKGFMLDKYNQYSSGGIPACKGEINQYSVKNQTRLLAGYLTKITGA